MRKKVDTLKARYHEHKDAITTAHDLQKCVSLGCGLQTADVISEQQRKRRKTMVSRTDQESDNPTGRVQGKFADVPVSEACRSSGHPEASAPTRGSCLPDLDAIECDHDKEVRQMDLKEQPAFLELFAGTGMLTKMVAKTAAVLQPHELWDDRGGMRTEAYDLKKKTVQDKILEQIKRGRVRWLHCAPPRRTYSSARRFGKWAKVKILRTCEQPLGIDPLQWEVAEANILTKFTAKACRMQARAGGWFSIENPETSLIWETPCMKALKLLPTVEIKRGDQCRLGAPWIKPTSWLTNCAWLDIVKRRHCKWTCPKHITLEGKTQDSDGKSVWWAQLAAAYPEEMCCTLAKEYTKALDKEPNNVPKKVGYDNLGMYAEHEGEARRRRQDRENNSCLGGLRRPHRGNRQVPGYLQTGEILKAALYEVVRRNKHELEEMISDIGQEKCTGIADHIVEQTQHTLIWAFGAQVDLSDEGLQGGLWRMILENAGDPETEVPSWLETFTPLGLVHPIVPSGVFPTVPERSVGPELTQLVDLMPGWSADQAWAKTAEHDVNYSSYTENQKEIEEELRKEYAKGFMNWYPTAKHAEKHHKGIVVSKMGAVVTVKDGHKKVRVIHDLRRSLVNAKIRIAERLVLPRMSDVIDDCVDLMLATETSEDVEAAVFDFKDAFKHLRVAPEEQPYLAGRAWGGLVVYLVVLFGVGSGPLVWGRVAAAAMRMTQALLGDRGRIECFVDDALMFTKGKQRERQRDLLAVLLLWRALGLQLSWRKGSIGRTVKWIGAHVSVDAQRGVIVISIPADKIDQLKKDCQKWLHGKGMIAEKELRIFAGRGSWLGGLLPQVRPFVRQVWGALAAPRSAKAKHLVYRKQVASALHWLLTLADVAEGGLSRTVHAADKHKWGLVIVTDASPWGGGALLWSSWQAYDKNEPANEFIQVEWTALHERLVMGKVGLPEHQASFEMLMMILALRTWTDHHTRGTVTMVGDAAGALCDLVAMRAKTVVLNNLIKEAALHLAPLGLDVQGLHIWGVNNEMADQLSRWTASGARPSWLTSSTKKRIATTAQPQFWRHCCSLPTNAKNGGISGTTHRF